MDSTTGQMTANRGPVDIAFIMVRAKRVVTDPVGCWSAIKADNHTIKDVYTKYFMITAAIPAVAGFIGMVLGYGIFFGALIQQLIVYGISLGMAYIAAVVIEFLAPKFGGAPTRTDAFKLVVYARTPADLAGILLLIPSALLSLISGILGLYSIYVFYQGVTPMTSMPESKRIPFMLVTFIICIIIAVVLMTVLGAIGIGVGAGMGAASL